MDDDRIFKFQKQDSIGSINSVDTGLAYAVINSDEILSVLQVNQLVAIESPESGKHIIGMIIKIYRKADINNQPDGELEDIEIEDIGVYNQIKLVFIGELRDKLGNDRNVFKRNVSNVPRINAQCYRIEGEVLTDLMQSISSCIKSGIHPLSIGKYSMDESSVAYLDGNKFFQRHAAIVGSTGSGKSYCVAKIIEEMSHLKLVNAVLFDIHGEYSSPDFNMDGIKHLKIASPSDLSETSKLSKGILMVPYWLLNYEEMQALLLDRSDQNAPNQAMLLSKEIMFGKEQETKDTDYSDLVTLDSPVPYRLIDVLSKLKNYDTEMVPGKTTEKQGPYFGKLTRFNQRLENKLQDKRMGFMFSISDEEMKSDWLKSFCHTIMGNDGGVKIVNLSEVPSDVLPLVVGLLSRIIFSVQQWSEQDKAHPIALLCDEAHLYVQHLESSDSVARIGLKSFERIAKEGRKYGVGLVVISQRPSEVNRTVLSQCNNFVSLRLTNVDDQNVIKRLLPDNLGNIADNLSLLDIGEAIVVGDATLLPSKIRIDEPSIKPSSQTIPFWDIWAKDTSLQNLDEAVDNMIKQSK